MLCKGHLLKELLWGQLEHLHDASQLLSLVLAREERIAWDFHPTKHPLSRVDLLYKCVIRVFESAAPKAVDKSR